MADNVPTADAILAWARLVRAQQVVLGAVEGDLKAAGFPPLSWYDVLLELRRAEAGQLRPVEIESRLLIAQHNVSRLIDRLEKAGYVVRQPCEDDGRGQIVAISESGCDLLRHMWPPYQAAIQRCVGRKLKYGEASSLAELLGRLLEKP